MELILATEMNPRLNLPFSTKCAGLLDRVSSHSLRKSPIHKREDRGHLIGEILKPYFCFGNDIDKSDLHS